MRAVHFFFCAVSLLALAGCSTDREYAISHEQTVQAAIAAICDDANVKPGEVQRSDTDEKGGRLTVLTAPYKRQSRVECKIDSREKHKDQPNLEIRVVSNDTFYTRHKEWEWRMHEVVASKLKAKEHGAESKPSSLPQVKPQLPPEEPKKPAREK